VLLPVRQRRDQLVRLDQVEQVHHDRRLCDYACHSATAPITVVTDACAGCGDRQRRSRFAHMMMRRAGSGIEVRKVCAWVLGGTAALPGRRGTCSLKPGLWNVSVRMTNRSCTSDRKYSL